MDGAKYRWMKNKSVGKSNKNLILLLFLTFYKILFCFIVLEPNFHVTEKFLIKIQHYTKLKLWFVFYTLRDFCLSV